MQKAARTAVGGYWDCGGAGLLPKRLLEWCQRAYPAGEFNQRAPCRRGQVSVREPRPAQHQQPTQDYEENEREVNNDDEIGHERVNSEEE